VQYERYRMLPSFLSMNTKSLNLLIYDAASPTIRKAT
jgi:hypothetical protein